MKRIGLVAVVACGSASTPVSAPAPAPTPAPTVAAPVVVPPAPLLQRFADHDPGYRFADPDRKAKLAAAFPKIDAAVAEEMARQSLPGLALGIVIDGELAYTKGYGVVSPDAKTAPDADTVYRIGSISKSFTGLATLMLRDDGALNLDDPLVTYWPPASGIVYPSHDTRPITLRQLLTHTSGLPRMVGEDDDPSEAVFAKRFDGLPLESAPGTTFTYSNAGFGVLGIVVAKASHMPLRDFIATRIFTPLGMTSTRYDPPTERLAPPIDEHGKVTQKLSQIGSYEGAGAIYSTVRDMAKYLALQLSAYPPRDGDEPIVRRATLRESHDTGAFTGLHVRTKQPLRVAAGTYGFGWGHFASCDFDDEVDHNGAIDSYRSQVDFLERRGVGVVILSNFPNANVGAISEAVTHELQKTGALKPYVAHPKPSPYLEPTMKKFLAIYNEWDEAALKAMLARPLDPREHDEIAGYKALHGTCSAFTLGEVTTPLSAHFVLTCERGALDMLIELAPDGRLGGFGGTSTKIAIPADVARLAADVVGLAGKWNDKIYERDFADPKSHRAVYFAGAEQLRAAEGTCKIVSSGHEVSDWQFDLECEHGKAVAGLTVDKGKITALSIHPPANAGPCE